MATRPIDQHHRYIGHDGALVARLDDGTVEVEAKPRQRRQRISHTRKDGSVPCTLGGALPARSILSRREFGMRALKR
jgi:hypothetical protein